METAPSVIDVMNGIRRKELHIRWEYWSFSGGRGMDYTDIGVYQDGIAKCTLRLEDFGHMALWGRPLANTLMNPLLASYDADRVGEYDRFLSRIIRALKRDDPEFYEKCIFNGKFELPCEDYDISRKDALAQKWGPFIEQ